MKISLFLPLLIAGLFAAGNAQAQVLVDSSFAQPDKSPSTVITDSEVDTGWFRVNEWTRDGFSAGARSYSVGEMGRGGGAQNDPNWFGQVIDGGSSTGVMSLDLDYRIKDGTGSFFVEVYGANGVSAPAFALDNDTMGPGWTLLNATTEIAISGTDNAVNNQVTFDLGLSGYDYLGVRLRSEGLGNNTVGRELAFQQVTIVPEMSTVSLFGLGLLGLAFVRRRRVT